jgi:galactonate dehydratase
MAGAGAFATIGLLGEMVQAADAPALAVEDKHTGIKISAVSTIPLGKKTLVKIQTNHGVVGWGEITQVPPRVACALVESMFELLDGENPTRVEYLWQKLFRAHRDFRGGSIEVHTLSGIDMALWDIAGKLNGVPVYRLLGGPTRDKIRVYPTPTATKTGPGAPFMWSGSEHEVRQLVSRVESARKQVGPDGSVMFDCHCMLPPPIMIQFANAIESYNVLWVEEVACPGNLEVFKRIKAQCRVPVALGERDRTIWEVIGYLRNNCIDILQFDCGHDGGISQMRKAAALCESYHVPLAPHCTLSSLGQSASFNAIATVPNFLIHEFYPNDLKGVCKPSWEIDKDHNYILPQAPGIGCDIDEALALQHSKESGFDFKWPGSHYPDGSICDY